jgi:hypothetical protein
LWTGKRAVVYVRVPNRETPSFIYREITLGAESGSFYVVANGLEEGEEIVTGGFVAISRDLYDGAIITIKEESKNGYRRGGKSREDISD